MIKIFPINSDDNTGKLFDDVCGVLVRYEKEITKNKSGVNIFKYGMEILKLLDGFITKEYNPVSQGSRGGKEKD